MLIYSPRITPRDRETWERLAGYDAALAASPRLDALTQRALAAITPVIEAGDCYLSTSWGKDSTVVVDLAGKTGLAVPMVWMRAQDLDMPECVQVRDTMLDRYPDLRESYTEVTFPRPRGRWWDDPSQSRTAADAGPAGKGWRHIGDVMGARHITGIRAEESRVRRLIQGRDGHTSKGACRPIGTWDATDVFAYLHRHDLPVHPAYAMTAGGHYDRRWLRVHSLGGVTGADRGRSEWETAYYSDVIDAAKAATEPRLERPAWGARW